MAIFTGRRNPIAKQFVFAFKKSHNFHLSIIITDYSALVNNLFLSVAIIKNVVIKNITEDNSIFFENGKNIGLMLAFTSILVGKRFISKDNIIQETGV